MNLVDYLPFTRYTIISGGKFLWTSYGPNARVLDASTDYGSASAIFDTETGEVREITVSDSLDRNQNYRWRDPDFIKANEEEYKAKGYNSKSVDDVDETWGDTDADWDILNKVEAILFNRSFDPNVVITFNLEEDMERDITALAAKKGKTFDDMMLEAIMELAEKEKKANNVVD